MARTYVREDGAVISRRQICLLIALVVLPLGCKTITAEDEVRLAKPVDCTTAEQDIATLEDERRSVAERALTGVRMVLPAAIVMGILRRDMRNRAEVATGAYNEELEAKIAEIRGACGLPGPVALE